MWRTRKANAKGKRMKCSTLKFEIILLSVGFLIIGALTSKPLNLDLSRTVSDWSQMGVKLLCYVILGGVIVALSTIVASRSKEWSRMIGTFGFYLLLYPMLALVSAVENVSGLLAVGSIFSLCCFSYIAADQVTNRMSFKALR